MHFVYGSPTHHHTHPCFQLVFYTLKSQIDSNPTKSGQIIFRTKTGLGYKYFRSKID
eukprot:TRINITY_DN6637_c0_g1_i1.p2 TRINITY_DN6637_c0_g1~~TRINITY_DN6637_c0_g1_i1.p2  ORF type:complete len:57 (-),score=0.63 TRINITY_DN6637_c0_g1_i1:185-355(-)